MTEKSLEEFLHTEPDCILEHVARHYQTTLLEVVRQLPGSKMIAGSHFDAVWQEVTTWGKVMLLIHTEDVILECSIALPTGFYSHGYFNLRGKEQVSGHIKADRCTHIAFIERKFMALDAATILFFNAAGSAMLKIFVGRDEHHQLLAPQLAAFRALAQSLAQ
ncbi:heme utilization cystosolic carrier protein HutX [Kosakonia cowanii]|uniref:heme utilization cystosolic carrier protein HutX n=1 Tax=Kosakonia cowanii TaxID=208223 RepID=UPI0023F81FB2|nr:heme utilization cystosolic carrier protein HutX [Kosakonia cowanii]MDF7758551.1 heme utilization cystosolic carrier protein HutX [Kosakonia cowanii]